MPVILVLALAPAVVAAIDSLVRALLVSRSRREAAPVRGERPGRCLVVIPARAEGERLRATIESVRGQGADTLLLLDGADPDAVFEGIDVVIKEPAGPSKAAALAWLVRTHRARLEAYDVILVLDAGSRLGPDFFEHFLWPAGADAVQAWLSGSGEGVGAAAAASEHFAQTHEDRGRESLGWNVRLRGTGSAFRTAAFLATVPRLATRIEDSEASVLITADGGMIRMAPPDAIVFDEKPSSVEAAASQRARWLLGRYELLFKRFGSFAAIAVRRPGEGLAHVAEIFGRPLSLTVPLRIGAAAIAMMYDRKLLAAFLAGSTLLDVAGHVRAAGRVPHGTAEFAASWAAALLLLPRAVGRWLRVDR